MYRSAEKDFSSWRIDAELSFIMCRKVIRWSTYLHRLWLFYMPLYNVNLKVHNAHFKSTSPISGDDGKVSLAFLGLITF